MAALPLPPGPPPVSRNPLAQMRFARRFLNNMLGEITDSYNQYGDVVYFHLEPNFDLMLFRNPEHVHEILVSKASSFIKGRDYTDTRRGLARFLGTGLLTSDGDFWKRQRRLVAPALHARRVESYAGTMAALAEAHAADWRDGAVLDIDDRMMRLTLAIVARTLFNSDVSGDAQRVGDAMEIFQHMNDRQIDVLPEWVPTRKRARERRALADLNEVVYRVIQTRRAEGVDQGDLLSMLLLARDDDGSAMSDRQARDETMTLFLAGHETTANALNWTWLLLAQHPAVEQRLHEELDQVLAGRTPTLEDLKRLPYTEMVVKETLRLYPPAWGFGREAAEEVEIGGYRVPRGTQINNSIYHVHHHPGIWPDPERFDPERFAPENEAKIPRMGYLPFGAGPRVCIGNSFAMMEARLILATLASRWRLRLLDATPVTPEPLITLRPRGGLRMRAEARLPVATAAAAASA